MKKSGRNFFGKKELLKRAISRNAGLASQHVLETLKKKGIKTTLGYVQQIRSEMKREGRRVPDLRRKRGLAVRLGSKTAVVMKIIAENSRMRTAEIAEEAKRRGTDVSMEHIYEVRKGMSRIMALPKLPTSLPKEIPVLSHAQEKVKEKAMPSVKSALKRETRKYRFNPQDAEDLRSYVLQHLPAWIVRFDPEKSPLSIYVQRKTAYATIDFIRSGIKSATGLKVREVRQLGKIVSGIRGGKTIQQIAKEEGMKLKDAMELFEAYQGYKRRVQFKEKT